MYRHRRNFRNEKKLELAVNINSGATLSRHLYLISPENLKDPWRMANGKWWPRFVQTDSFRARKIFGHDICRRHFGKVRRTNLRLSFSNVFFKISLQFYLWWVIEKPWRVRNISIFVYRKNEYYLCFLGHSLFPFKIGRSREIIVKNCSS